jgi:hypothetical protein
VRSRLTIIHKIPRDNRLVSPEVCWYARQRPAWPCFFLESTFKDQINPKRQTAGPLEGGSPELDLGHGPVPWGCGFARLSPGRSSKRRRHCQLPAAIAPAAPRRALGNFADRTAQTDVLRAAGSGRASRQAAGGIPPGIPAPGGSCQGPACQRHIHPKRAAPHETRNRSAGHLDSGSMETVHKAKATCLSS